MSNYILRNRDLEIENAKFDGGVLVDGWVVNGGWHYRVRDGQEQACYSAESEKPVSSRPFQPQELFKVPDGFRGNPFVWAEAQAAKKGGSV